jgi:quinol monooxygenase YgiN
MAQPIQYAIQWRVHEGRTDEFVELARHTTKQAYDNEPALLGYNWYRDESGFTLLEQHTDSAGILLHTRNQAAQRERFLALAQLSLEVYGEVDAAVRAQLSTLGASYHPYVAGFSRYPDELPAGYDQPGEDAETGQVQLTAHFQVADGRGGDFLDVVAEAAELVEAREPGMLGYLWYELAPGREYLLLEQYSDREHILFHRDNAAAQRGKFQSMSTSDVRVFGDVGPAAHAVYVTANARFLDYVVGFSRYRPAA